MSTFACATNATTTDPLATAPDLPAATTLADPPPNAPPLTPDALLAELKLRLELIQTQREILRAQTQFTRDQEQQALAHADLLEAQQKQKAAQLASDAFDTLAILTHSEKPEVARRACVNILAAANIPTTSPRQLPFPAEKPAKSTKPTPSPKPAPTALPKFPSLHAAVDAVRELCKFTSHQSRRINRVLDSSHPDSTSHFDAVLKISAELPAQHALAFQRALLAQLSAQPSLLTKMHPPTYSNPTPSPAPAPDPATAAPSDPDPADNQPVRYLIPRSPIC